MMRKTDVQVLKRLRIELSEGYHVTLDVCDYHLTGWFGGDRRGIRGVLWNDNGEYPYISEEKWFAWNRDSKTSWQQWKLNFDMMIKELAQTRNLEVLSDVEEEYGAENVIIGADRSGRNSFKS